MYKVTEIISKPVINLYNGNSEGTVKNICFDKGLKKALSLVLFSDNDEEELILPINKIYKIGTNAITIKNNEGLLPTLFSTNTEYNNQINNNVFNLEGELLGKVKDITLTSSFKVENIEIENASYPSSSVISFNSSNLIINSSGAKFSKETFKPKINSAPKLDIVKILPKIEEPNNEIIPKIDFKEIELKPKQSYKISENPLPQRMITSQNYLLGRKLCKTIYGINNEIIAKKDCLITEKILNTAKSHNKLVELAVFSKIK